jgi:AraC-like DNA-binding protein
MVGSTYVRPHPFLRHAVESILDIDVPDGAMARALTTRLLPTVSPQLTVHYRAPMGTDRGGKAGRVRHILVGVQSRLVTNRPSGPIGAMVAQFTLEAASLLVGGDAHELTDAHVELSDVIGAFEASLLVERLAEAATMIERVAVFQAFLFSLLHEREADPLAHRAARYLRRQPALSIRQIAVHLDVSERHLARRFNAAVGAGPKQFARIVRIGTVVAARRDGAAWADIAHGCGFNDQAHMINDFSSMFGHSPDAFFRAAAKFHWPREHVGLLVEGIPAGLEAEPPALEMA